MEASEKPKYETSCLAMPANRLEMYIYKTFEWATEGDNKKFEKVLEAFQRYCLACKTLCMSTMDSGISSKKTTKLLTDIYMIRIRIKIDLGQGRLATRG